MDLTFKTQKGRFNYRVGAIIIHDNKLLMVKNNKALSLFFYMKDRNELDTICLSFTENGAIEELQWLPLINLQDSYLYPEFFKEKLLHPLHHVEHIVTKE